MKKLFVSTIFFLTLITPQNIYGQWSNDPNQNLHISNFGYFVDACEDGMGGAFVGWIPVSTVYPTVWVQWIDKYGYVKWDAPIHITGEGESQLSFRLIKAEPGTTIIYFRDGKKIGMEPPPSPWPIYDVSNNLNKIDTTGALLWGAKGIDVTTTKNIIDTLLVGGVDIIPDGEYGAYVTWMNNYGKYYDDSSITRIQRIGKDGQRLWGDEGKYIYTWHGINAPSPYLGQRKPEGVFLLYSKQNYLPTIESINHDNSIRWEKTNKWYPYEKIEPDESGGAAWARLVAPASWDTGYTLIANRINSNGDLLWSDSGLVIQQKLLGPGTIVQKLLKDDTFVISFSNYVQMIKKDGELMHTKKFFYGDTTKRINGYGIFQSDSTNFIIAWGEDKNELYQYKCQKFSETFEKLWDVNVLYSGSGHPSRAYISDNRGGFIGVFSVYYPDTPGILAQQVSSNGVLGEVLTTVKEDNISISKDFHLYQNYPNPFNPSTQIQYVLPNTSNVIVTVYNSLGQTAKVFNEGTKEAGNHNITFNGEGLSSGIYLYSIHSVSIDGKQNFTAAKKMLLLK